MYAYDEKLKKFVKVDEAEAGGELEPKGPKELKPKGPKELKPKE